MGADIIAQGLASLTIKTSKNDSKFKRLLKYLINLIDNIKGDILAGHTIKTKYLIYFDRTETWSLYKLGDLPKEVITITSLQELIDLFSK